MTAKAIALGLVLLMIVFSMSASVANIASGSSSGLVEYIAKEMTHEERLDTLKGLAKIFFAPVIKIVQTDATSPKRTKSGLAIKYLGPHSPRKKNKETWVRRLNQLKAEWKVLESRREWEEKSNERKLILEREAEKRSKRRREREAKLYKLAKERQIREASISIGMTKAQAIYCWGQPTDKNITITARSTSEQWVYGDNRYLYFDNGILTTIQKQE